jgi:hypothetical protein
MTSPTAAPLESSFDLFTDDLRRGMETLSRALAGRNSGGNTPSVDSSDFPRQELADALVDAGDPAAGKRMALCGQGGAGWVAVCDADESHETIYHPFSCMLRVCPVCASKRAAQLADQIADPIARFAERSPSWYTLKHVVLTTSIGLDLPAEVLKTKIVVLRRAIIREFKRHWKGDKWLGGGIGVEFGEQGRKLHFHMLVHSRFVDKAGWLTPMWERVTGGLGKITYVSKVTDVYAGVRELTKYITKPQKNSSDDMGLVAVLSKLHMVLKGIRRFQTWGSFYHIAGSGRVQIDRLPDEHEPACCPTCSGSVHWVPELSYLLRTEQDDWNGQGGGSALDLITANNLGLPPPVDAGKQLAFWGDTGFSWRSLDPDNRK